MRKYSNYFILNEQYIFSIDPLNQDEQLYGEQNSLAQYCIYQGYEHFMRIIPNKYGEMLTTVNDNKFLVCQGRLHSTSTATRDLSGQLLAQFHKNNYTYPYEPRVVSSYGKWKQLWIDKLTFFEEELGKEKSVFNSKFLYRARNVLPYIIGISENAIQYLQENERNEQFTDYDQGTITFHRYRGQLEESFIPFGELIYDHPIRDLAELIRYEILNNKDGVINSFNFLIDYDSVLPISLYSWKLLYARLLFPVHFFDLFSKQISEKKDFTRELVQLKEKQTHYEAGIKQLFDEVERKYKRLPMYMVQWF